MRHARAMSIRAMSDRRRRRSVDPGAGQARCRTSMGWPLPAYATAGRGGDGRARGRGRDARPRRAPCGRDRARAGDPAGLRNPGPPALGAGAQARDHRAQHARHDRFGLSRRTEGDPDQPRHRSRSRSRRGDRIAQLVLAPVVQAAGSKSTSSTRPRAARGGSARPAGTPGWASPAGSASAGDSARACRSRG